MRRRPAACFLRSLLVASIGVACVLAVKSSAGEAGVPVPPRRLRVRFRRCRLDGNEPADCALVALWNVGAETTTDTPLRPVVSSPQFPLVTAMRVGCAPTVRSSVGETTTRGRRRHPAASSPQFPPAAGCRAGCVSVDTSSAGATTVLAWHLRPVATASYPSMPGPTTLAGCAPMTSSCAGDVTRSSRHHHTAASLSQLRREVISRAGCALMAPPSVGETTNRRTRPMASLHLSRLASPTRVDCESAVLLSAGVPRHRGRTACSRQSRRARGFMPVGWILTAQSSVGAAMAADRRRRLRACSLQSTWATSTRVGCAPPAPSSAGAATIRGRRRHLMVCMWKSQPELGTHARCVPTGRFDAGAATIAGRRRRPAAYSHQSLRGALTRVAYVVTALPSAGVQTETDRLRLPAMSQTPPIGPSQSHRQRPANRVPCSSPVRLPSKTVEGWSV